MSAYNIEPDSKFNSENDIKIGFFSKQEKVLSELKSKELWSQTRRECSALAEYWVNQFFQDIWDKSAKYKTYKKTGFKLNKAFSPLRESRANQESLYTTICAASIIMAGANEQQISPQILAIPKIYHEYLYYLNSIFDNKHGVNKLKANYSEKVKDYSLAANLVLTNIFIYLRELNESGVLNQKQYTQICSLIEKTNSEILLIWFNDINSDITKYFDLDLSQIEKQQELEVWINHAVEMTGVWTKLFAQIGAISTNQNYNKKVHRKTIEIYGFTWGFGQLINGFKDFTQENAVADDIREKRCTPQILHALFYSNPKDKKFIQNCILKSTKTNTDMTWKQKQRFVEIFHKIGTFEFIEKITSSKLEAFWKVYDNDKILNQSLVNRNINHKMKALIEGGFLSFFNDSRFLK